MQEKEQQKLDRRSVLNANQGSTDCMSTPTRMTCLLSIIARCANQSRKQVCHGHQSALGML